MLQRYQIPWIEDAFKLNPLFFQSLNFYFDEYQKSIQKSRELVTMFEEIIDKLNILKSEIVNKSDIMLHFESLNPIHQPLLSDLLSKTKSYFLTQNDPESTIDRIKFYSRNVLYSEFSEYIKIINMKLNFEKVHHQYFQLLFSKNTKQENKMHEIYLQEYRKMSLKFVFFLRCNIKKIGEIIHQSIYNYLKAINTMSLGFNFSKSDIEPNEFALDFIITNNIKDRDKDMSKIKMMFEKYKFDEVIDNFESFLVESPSKFIEPVNNSQSEILSNITNETNKILSSMFNFRKNSTVEDLQKSLSLNLSIFLADTAPSFVDGFKYGEKSYVGDINENYQMAGYLKLITKDLTVGEHSKPNVLYVILNSNDGYIMCQGSEDNTPIPLVYLCQCIIIIDQEENSSTFEILTHNRSISVDAFSIENRQNWVENIQSGIEENLSKIKYKIKDFHPSCNEPNIYKNVQAVIYSKEGNDSCADCEAKDPEWVNYHQGVTLCSGCAGAHRSFGSHNNHVRSLIHDYWNDMNFEHMLTLGNIKVNTSLEANTKGYFKPTQTSTIKERIEFVKKKYHNKDFI